MKYYLLFFIALSVVSCKKDEPESGNSAPNYYAYVVNDEGSNLVMTDADGEEYDLSSNEVGGWNYGQLLNSNYWTGFQTPLPGEGNLYIKYNLLEEMDWREEMEGESELYNQLLLLEWTYDLDIMLVEVYVPGSDNLIGRASGTITVELDAQTVYGEYDLVAHLDATFYNEIGEPISLKGDIWKKEF